MLKTRVIPCLLLRGHGLVKTTRFKDAVYIGDPINAIKIFNDKEVDELVVLDITATRERRAPNLRKIREMAGECFMPLGYGGGIRSVDQIREILAVGVEKVVLNTAAAEVPALVEQAAREFGSQSIVVSIDARRRLFGGYEVFVNGGERSLGVDPVIHAKRLEAAGAGEILLNSIDRDGTQQGYDLPLIRKVAYAVDIPVIACGGAGRLEHFRAAVTEARASAVAAGSMFVFYGKHRAVLISYPTPEEKRSVLP